MIYKDELLLNEVQKHSHLYDFNDENHENQSEREKAWNKIGKTLGVNDEECKETFRQLRDRYRKEKARGGVSDANEGQWRLFNSMRFLDDYDQPKTTWLEAATPISDDLSETSPVESTSLPPSDEKCLKNAIQETEETTTLTSIQSEVESLDATIPQIQSVKFTGNLPSPQDEASKRKNDSSMPCMCRLPEERKNCQEMDKTGKFLECIASRLRKMNEKTREMAFRGMLDIVLKAKYG
ncbi:hypothetical protein CEXT_200811 [Caerostris extrusa]|uniref:MADF domain-containing protein n=1 Tax=Caerostris extrusa TaxID=172846 RepID=A0AAV4XEB4_CAEEX|nr:hypothetical protein CEXT_200811 [Caerostris extrusa]